MFQTPTIEHLTLPCDRLPAAFDRLRILHLTDLHMSRWSAYWQSWQKVLQHARPDLLAITGDLTHRAWRWQTAVAAVVKLLDGINPPLGKFFILGNHDTLHLVAPLQAQGFQLLHNQAVIFPRGHQRLAVIGLNQHRRIDTDVPAALAHVHPGDFKIMLMHYPDLVHAAQAAGVDVCLAGHTHGGQICLPNGQPLWRHDSLHHTQTTGVHQFAGTWMVINRGIGVAGLKMRLFCPPQALLIELVRPAVK